MTIPVVLPAETRVLFVDADLDALERIGDGLRAARPAWSMRFAQSGEDALARLEREPADVVVSGLRMPCMDGAELLARVREQYPRAVRLMLSGPQDREGMLKAMSVAHQFLAKPCKPDELRAAVLRAGLLQARLHSPAVTHSLGTLSSLPALPRLYWDLTREMEGADASSASICAILEQDVAMTARVLQVVNSALFSLNRRVTHVRDAVTYLGFEPIRSLVVAAGLVRAMSSICAPAGFSLDEVQQHSLRVARVAMGLMRDPEDRKTAFSAAMLHDVGRLVLALGLPVEYARVRELALRSQLPAHEAEMQVFGCTHAEVGAHLLAVWGLPSALVEAVAFHHAPQALADTRLSIAGAVYVADWLEHAVSESHEAPTPLDHDYLRNAGVLAQLPVWRQQATARLVA